MVTWVVDRVLSTDAKQIVSSAAAAAVDSPRRPFETMLALDKRAAGGAAAAEGETEFHWGTSVGKLYRKQEGSKLVPKYLQRDFGGAKLSTG